MPSAAYVASVLPLLQIAVVLDLSQELPTSSQDGKGIQRISFPVGNSQMRIDSLLTVTTLLPPGKNAANPILPPCHQRILPSRAIAPSGKGSPWTSIRCGLFCSSISTAPGTECRAVRIVGTNDNNAIGSQAAWRLIMYLFVALSPGDR